jgi:hypothetical protein
MGRGFCLRLILERFEDDSVREPEVDILEAALLALPKRDIFLIIVQVLGKLIGPQLDFNRASPEL